MWIVVLVLAIAISLEPVRPTLVPFMLARPRPKIQLLAFFAGNFASGLLAGLLIVFVFHHAPFIGDGADGAKVQIGIGVVALVIAAVMASNISLPRRRSKAGEHPDVDVAESGEPPRRRALDKAADQWRAFLRKSNSPWLAGVLGLGTGLPSVDYIGALVVIISSGASPLAQVGALVMFLVVGNAIVVIPIVTLQVAPDRTQLWIERFQSWVRRRNRRQFGAIIAVVGILQILIGLGRL
ncbi:GAP family protein [soil metagenome]